MIVVRFEIVGRGFFDAKLQSTNFKTMASEVSRRWPCYLYEDLSFETHPGADSGWIFVCSMSAGKELIGRFGWRKENP